VTAARDDDRQDGWQRLHPLTPLLRGGRFGLVLVAAVGNAGLRQESPRTALAVFGAGVVLAALAGLVAWRTTRYRLTATELQVDSGLLTRRQRRVPLARLQSVEVVRPLLGRVLGLAELRLEVAGGGRTEAPLAFLRDDVAQALRGALLDRAAGRSAQDPVTPAELVLVTVPNGPLVWSTLLDGPVVVAVVALVAVAVAAAFDLGAALAVLAAAAPFLLGIGSAAGRRLLAEQGFTVAESADGLRLRHGLLETRASTIPAGRVQTVRLRRPLLWRPFGWVRVEVDVAGYAADRGEEQRATSALLPVAPLELATALVPRVLGGALPAASVRPPRRAVWAGPLAYRRLALGVDDRHVVVASGVLTTRTDVVPLAKVQSLRLRQGPWQRRLGLADLALDSAGRRLTGAVARHRDVAEARALLDELSARARRARAAG
jgi:putative membrane protein